MPIIRMPDGANVNFPDTMPKEQIKGLIATKFPDFAAQQSSQVSSDQALQQPSKQLPMQEEPSKQQDTSVFSDNPLISLAQRVSRAPILAKQGVEQGATNIANSLLDITRNKELTKATPLLGGISSGIDILEKNIGKPINISSPTKEIQAQGPFERAIEKTSEFVTEALPIAKVGQAAKTAGVLGEGVGALSRFSREALGASTKAQLIPAVGAGSLTGVVNPETTAGKIATSVIGGMTPGGIAAAGRKVVSSLLPSNELRTISKALGQNAEELTQQAQKEGKALIEIAGADKKFRKLTSDLAKASDEAGTLIGQEANNIIQQNAENVSSLLNQNIKLQGIKGKSLEDFTKSLDKSASPLFKKAEEAGALKGKNPNLDSILEKDFFKNRIEKLRGKDSAASDDLKGLDDSDIKVLEEVKKDLDGSIGKARRAGDLNEERLLIKRKNELLNELDITVPVYKEARKISGDKFKVEDAFDLGKKANADVGTDEIKSFLNTATPQEASAYKIGLKQNILDQIEKSGSDRNISDILLKGGKNRKAQLEALFDNEEELTLFIKEIDSASNKIKGLKKIRTAGERLSKEGDDQDFSSLILSPLTKFLPSVIGGSIRRIKGISPSKADKIAEVITSSKKTSELADVIKDLNIKQKKELKFILTSGAIAPSLFGGQNE